MKDVAMTPIAALLLAFAAAFGNTVYATPLNELKAAPVSMLEFGSFKLEMALTAIRDWPFPIEGTSVAYHVDPDQLEIVVSVKNVPLDSFRTACARSVGRVREFLYVDANGVARMGRSHLSAYFWGSRRGGTRESVLRAVDQSTRIRVNVVGAGGCHAALINAPITFDASAPK